MAAAVLGPESSAATTRVTPKEEELSRGEATKAPKEATLKEADEDEVLLTPTLKRFVILPIEYPDVNSFFLFSVPSCIDTGNRSGNSTKRQKPLSGPPKKSISPKTFTIGKTRSTPFSPRPMAL